MFKNSQGGQENKMGLRNRGNTYKTLNDNTRRTFMRTSGSEFFEKQRVDKECEYRLT